MLYEKQSRQRGHDLDDWLNAERLLLAELKFKASESDCFPDDFQNL